MSTRLEVRVHPGARRRGVRGWRADGSLKLEVEAAPEGGKANEAVIELLADWVGVRRDQVRVVRGHASRVKWIEIEGVDSETVRARIDARVGGDVE